MEYAHTASASMEAAERPGSDWACTKEQIQMNAAATSLGWSGPAALCTGWLKRNPLHTLTRRSFPACLWGLLLLASVPLDGRASDLCCLGVQAVGGDAPCFQH